MMGLKLYFVVLVFIGYVSGHGMMLDPVNRASRWREDKTAPANYDDNGLYCGGYAVQWSAYAGKCGLCGDSYGDQVPRAHELGGTYGQGTIVKKYNAGQEINVSVKVTQNHKGKFIFELCDLDSRKSESEECFKANQLKLKSGESEYYLNSDDSKVYNATLVLPSNVKCKHCVLRWTYLTANSWGTCDDGTGAIGCGPQEQFKNCADVAIN
ncbi:uncharacterized protein LOC129942229 [Eupeodes corollae]|uniref:uncharacterized protein LOC129942229 n=1 Tax=Eupeodes corollae TaxID=290404 RepID=UPI00248F7358|nr:uncharacterized protein LOC129942229 [Eupeodes corollae]